MYKRFLLYFQKQHFYNHFLYFHSHLYPFFLPENLIHTSHSVIWFLLYQIVCNNLSDYSHCFHKDNILLCFFNLILWKCIYTSTKLPLREPCPKLKQHIFEKTEPKKGKRYVNRKKKHPNFILRYPGRKEADPSKDDSFQKFVYPLGINPIFK